MNRIVLMLACSVTLLCPPLAAAVSLSIAAHANPQRIAGGGISILAIRVLGDDTPVAGQAVVIELVSGHECGSAPPGGSTAADGTITNLQFRGAQYVEDCVATMRVTATGAASADGTAPTTVSADVTVTVNPVADTPARLDGISAVALILLVSFAIDRLVRGLFFLLSYWPWWGRVFPDPELDDVPASARTERNRRLVYVVAAGVLGMAAIGWFGRVRLLAALGFTTVNPWLDVLVTGLILAGGADRTEQLLKSLGGTAPRSSGPPPAPIQITGRLVLDDQGKKAAGGDRSPE